MFSQIDYGHAGVLARGRWLLPAALLWMAVLFGVTTAAFFASFRLPDWISQLRGHDYACAVLIPAAMVLLYVVAVSFGERRKADEFSLSHALLELLIGVIVGFAFITLALLLLWALGLYSVEAGHWKNGLQYLVFNSYVSAVLEELAFRAILLRIVARMFGPLTGLLVSSVLFGLAHAGHASAIAVVQVMINGGLIFGLLYLVSGRLWLPIGAHIAYDFTEWSLMGVGDKDGLLVVTPAPGHPAWLTGGEFGPDGSVLAVVVGVFVIVAIIVLSRRFSSTPAAVGLATSHG